MNYPIVRYSADYNKTSTHHYVAHYWQKTPGPECELRRYWHRELRIAGAAASGFCLVAAASFISPSIGIPLGIGLLLLSNYLAGRELNAKLSAATTQEINNTKVTYLDGNTNLLPRVPIRIEILDPIVERDIHRYFGGYLKQQGIDYRIGHNYLRTSAIYPYESDFEIPQANLHIAIDKPYSGSSILHAIEDPSDKERDGIFAMAGIATMRFSEYQIVTAPRACAAAVAAAIAIIQDAKIDENTLSLARSLPLDPCWNRALALRRIQTKYRNSYLTQIFPNSNP